MAMQWLEQELRKTGSPQDNLNADLVATMLSHRGKDIPMPQYSTMSEIEAPKIQRFSPEARVALEAKGFEIYELTGRSMASLRKEGFAFFSTWPQYSPEFEELPSKKSEVAINPRQFFIPESNNMTFEEQLEMIAEVNGRLQIGGATMMIADVVDYVDLAFMHSNKTGNELFGERGTRNHTRTQTVFNGNLLRVGDSGEIKNVGIINVDYFSPSARVDNVFIAPLIVPIEEAEASEIYFSPTLFEDLTLECHNL